MATTLVDDTKTNMPDIDSFLSGYKSDMTILNPSAGGSVPNPSLSNPVINTINGLKDQWQGNPKYYQTGKKAGQLKPSAIGNTPVKPQGTAQQGQPLPNTPANTTGTVQSTLITGALFLVIVDVCIPFAVASVNNWLSKDKIDSTKLQLTEKQRKDLEPLANEVVKYLNLNANPVVLFLIGYGGIVTMNFMLQKSLSKSKAKEESKS